MLAHPTIDLRAGDRAGEIAERRLTPDHCDILDWVSKLAGPVAMTYEAGPAGFGLARALEAAGIECLVAAPSKLIRPAGDRVKTDAHDAVHLGPPLTIPLGSWVSRECKQRSS